MPSAIARVLWTTILSTSLVQVASAHSHISSVIINGLLYRGFDPKDDGVNADNVVGWSTSASDDGFVPPSNYTTPDIICHRDGAPVKAHAPVRAGDKIHLQWNGWPLSHKGPVLSYLAPCDPASTDPAAGDGCASVDKAKLSFFKIDNSSPAFSGVGADGPPGDWATDVLISQNNSWLIEVPPKLEPGPYVLRHELIALHYANKPDGAQNYPQCLNLWVMPQDGTDNNNTAGAAVGAGQGEPAEKLYREDDPGVAINIYQTLTTYDIPGPTVVSGAAPIPLVSQAKSMPTADGTPVSVSASTAAPFPAGAAAAVPTGESVARDEAPRRRALPRRRPA